MYPQILFFLWGLLACSGNLGAAQVVETEQGKVLVSAPQVRKEGGGEVSAGRDPFNWSDVFAAQFLAGRAEKKEIFSSLKVSGIVWNVSSPLVIINNRLLREGELVEGVMVVQILPDSVLLAKDGFQHTLKFQNNVIDLGDQEGMEGKQREGGH